MLLLHLWVHLEDLITLFQFDKYVRNQAADIRKNKFIFFQQFLFFQNSFFIYLFLDRFFNQEFMYFSGTPNIFVPGDSVFMLFKCFLCCLPRGVFKQRHSTNIQTGYRRTSMQKCDFNFIENHTSAQVFLCKYAMYLHHNPFFYKHICRTASVYRSKYRAYKCRGSP